VTGAWGSLQGKSLRTTSVARPAMSRASTVKVMARDSPWLPGLESPSYLTGTMPADFGFDPLGFVRPQGPSQDSSPRHVIPVAWGGAYPARARWR
jgi:hypothetical protein